MTTLVGYAAFMAFAIVVVMAVLGAWPGAGSAFDRGYSGHVDNVGTRCEATGPC